MPPGRRRIVLFHFLLLLDTLKNSFLGSKLLRFALLWGLGFQLMFRQRKNWNQISTERTLAFVLAFIAFANVLDDPIGAMTCCCN
jgi:hypothetical protein